MAKIKELPKQFIGRGQVKGFKFTQISKTDSAFLYLIDTDDMIYYEVFRKRINRRYACESYPTDKAYGIWASTTPDIIRAIEILNELSMERSIVSAIHTTNIQSELSIFFCV